MRLLALETTCDETAAAVVADGPVVLSSVVASQDELHAATGGVVPEVAARQHLRALLPVVRRALADAATGWGRSTTSRPRPDRGCPGRCWWV